DEMRVSAAAFAPDFSPERPHLYLWCNGVTPPDRPFRVWDLQTDARVAWAFAVDPPAPASVASPGPPAACSVTVPRPVKSARSAPDGRWILVADGQRTVAWDGITRSPREVAATPAVAPSPDERFSVTGGLDGITRIQEVATGTLVCSLVSFVDGTWAVVDPE